MTVDSPSSLSGFTPAPQCQPRRGESVRLVGVPAANFALPQGRRVLLAGRSLGEGCCAHHNHSLLGGLIMRALAATGPIPLLGVMVKVALALREVLCGCTSILNSFAPGAVTFVENSGFELVTVTFPTFASLAILSVITCGLGRSLLCQ